MKSKKGIIIGSVIGVVAIVIAFAVVVFGVKSLNSFDAQGYVRGILEQNFKGEIKEVSTVVDGQTEETLLQQYEDGIEAFLKNRLMYGVEMDEETEEKYIALCKEIFKTMKYEVKEAEKVGEEKYQVPVEYQTSDVFLKFDTLIAEESARIFAKADKGEYLGTVDEINLQMQQEFLDNSYELLKKANEEAEYGEKETVVIVVEKNEKGLYTMGTQLNEFVLKITCEDVNQD